MISLTVEVVAHQSRLSMANCLARTVQADAVWVDDGFLGEWKNHLRALNHASRSDSSHAVILQDDACPIEDFRGHVQKAIESRPNEIIGLYVGTHRPWRHEVLAAVELADKLDASWLSAPTLLWGVGVVLPTELIPTCLDYCKRSKLPYDQRIGNWCQSVDRLVYYTWPSLVDHADTDTVAHKDKAQGIRVAHRTGVPSWNDVSVEIPRPGVKFMVASTRNMTNQKNRLDIGA